MHPSCGAQAPRLGGALIGCATPCPAGRGLSPMHAPRRRASLRDLRRSVNERRTVRTVVPGRSLLTLPALDLPGSVARRAGDRNHPRTRARSAGLLSNMSTRPQSPRCSIPCPPCSWVPVRRHRESGWPCRAGRACDRQTRRGGYGSTAYAATEKIRTLSRAGDSSGRIQPLNLAAQPAPSRRTELEPSVPRQPRRVGRPSPCNRRRGPRAVCAPEACVHGPGSLHCSLHTRRCGSVTSLVIARSEDRIG